MWSELYRDIALTTGQYLDIALWSGQYVIYNPVISFDLRCQSGIYHINNVPIKEVTFVKYLGIVIDSWKEHIKQVLSKVNAALEYASMIWAPHTNQDIQKMLQRRAARFVFNTYQNNISVTSLLNSLGWPTLETRRSYLKLNLTYKTVKESDFYFSLIILHLLLVTPVGTNTIYNTYNVLVIFTNIHFPLSN